MVLAFILLTILSTILWRVFEIKDSLKDTFKSTIVDEKAFEKSFSSKVSTSDLVRKGVLRIDRVKAPRSFYNYLFKYTTLICVMLTISFCVKLLMS